MDTLYLLLKFLHITSVIVWLGGLLTLSIVTARIARGGDRAAVAALGQANEYFGQRVVSVAGVVTLLAGGAMVSILGISFTTLWIVWGLVGIAASILLGAFPIRRAGEELDALARTSPTDPRLASLQSRLRTLSALNLLILFSVVVAMVFKPTL